jgi:hypothetical protein
MSWRFAYKSVIDHLSVPSLYGELQKLENSVKHLRRSNDELRVHREEEGQGGSWVLPVISENESVIAKQEEQIQLLKEKILEREAATEIQVDEFMRIDQGQSNGTLRQVEGNGTANPDTEEDMDIDKANAGVHL